MAPTLLASSHHSLPPILHMNIQATVSSCSKGARGLSVFPRVGGIFTSTTISLDPSLRQLPSRYAIHAGQYLTDKEFRYLRTVIVTAAVYSGFDQMLPLLPIKTVSPSLSSKLSSKLLRFLKPLIQRFLSLIKYLRLKISYCGFSVFNGRYFQCFYFSFHLFYVQDYFILTYHIWR